MRERSSMESVKESLKLTLLSLGVKLNSLRLARGAKLNTLVQQKEKHRYTTHTHTTLTCQDLTWVVMNDKPSTDQRN